MVTVIKTKGPASAKARAGRPRKEETGRVRERILDVATVFFFRDGYGATTIDGIARDGQIAKRTIYSRFPDKAALFTAVVHELVEKMRPPGEQHLMEGKTLESILLVLASVILRASLSPDALSLQRLVLAEATRFPELAIIVHEQGRRSEAITRIAALLRNPAFTDVELHDSAFSAEQFLSLLTAAPQRRALGMGVPMTEGEIDAWGKKTVRLFLKGYSAL